MDNQTQPPAGNDEAAVVKFMGPFEPSKSYPIETLPDDLHDENVVATNKWSVREVLLWNDCQGWWMQGASEYWTQTHLSEHGHAARFWSPLPHDPMTRAEMLAERGEVVCPKCDWAIKPGEPHNCRPSPLVLHMNQSRTVAGHPCHDWLKEARACVFNFGILGVCLCHEHYNNRPKASSVTE